MEKEQMSRNNELKQVCQMYPLLFRFATYVWVKLKRTAMMDLNVFLDFLHFHLLNWFLFCFST